MTHAARRGSQGFGLVVLLSLALHLGNDAYAGPGEEAPVGDAAGLDLAIDAAWMEPGGPEEFLDPAADTAGGMRADPRPPRIRRSTRVRPLEYRNHPVPAVPTTVSVLFVLIGVWIALRVGLSPACDSTAKPVEEPRERDPAVPETGSDPDKGRPGTIIVHFASRARARAAQRAASKRARGSRAASSSADTVVPVSERMASTRSCISPRGERTSPEATRAR